jgi:quinol monooxygenase YgiN
MMVLVCRMQFQPEKTEQVVAAMEAVLAPSRATDGVISFDLGRDLADPNVVIATEVFEDEAARDRQESLPEVLRVLDMLPDSLAGPPELTIYQVPATDAAAA